MCNCSRCQRNGQIKNFLQMYLKIDGDPILIKEQTCFGRYLSQCDLKPYFKNNQVNHPLRIIFSVMIHIDPISR